MVPEAAAAAWKEEVEDDGLGTKPRDTASVVLAPVRLTTPADAGSDTAGSAACDMSRSLRSVLAAQTETRVDE